MPTIHDVMYDPVTKDLQFWVAVDDDLRPASVTFECLADHCGLAIDNAVAPMTAYARNLPRLQEIAVKKIRAGQDPVVVVETADWY